MHLFNETYHRYGHTNDIMLEVPAAMNWLEEKGFLVHMSRYSRYQKYIDAFYEENPLSDESPKKFEKLNWAFQELFELVQIYKCFQDECSHNFNERLKKIVAGQDLASQVLNAKNDSSRDFLYELVIASEFKNRGFNIHFNDDADVVAVRGLDVVVAECKKLKSENSLERNLKKAGEQLSRRPRKDTYGLIFIDITSCLMDHIPIYEYSSDQLMIDKVRSEINQYQKKNISILERYADQFQKDSLGICLTYKRTLWIGIGSYLRTNYYTDMSIQTSRFQPDVLYNKLIEILSANCKY